MLMEGKGLLGGVCRSVCDRDNLVGEFGPGSEPAEDQAVIKLRTAREEGQVRSGQVVEWKNKKGAQGNVPLGLGMLAGIPGCRTRACQCDLHEGGGGVLGCCRAGWLEVAGVLARANGKDWKEEGVIGLEQGDGCGIQAATEDDRGAKDGSLEDAN